MHSIRIGHRLDRSEIYGPGIRSVIWVQGCNLACKGCWNTQFWNTTDGELILVSDLLDEIGQIDGISGITILGGEPLQQANGVLELIQGCKKIGLHIFLYTGYNPDEFDCTMQECFDLSDIVISGRSIESLRDTSLRWRGSLNQIIHYPKTKSICQDQIETTEIEFHLDTFGRLSVFGYPSESLLEVGEI